MIRQTPPVVDDVPMSADENPRLVASKLFSDTSICLFGKDPKLRWFLLTSNFKGCLARLRRFSKIDR